ncbi:unnamed protein product [Ectocarpus sp. CCAP 1310/34]|nr:unnamed protein product [Ectocarpus sp. CCAP 1310/34]
MGLRGRGSGATKGRRVLINRLEEAGVFRWLGTNSPRRVWWLAYRGKDATRPRFEDRGEDNLCEPAGSGAEEHVGTERYQPGLTPDEQQEEELPENTKRRVAWVRSDAMHAMVSTPTWGYFLNLFELSRLLDLPADDLRAVLQPPCARKSAIEHELFLSTFGISRGCHDGKPAWHLLGCGHAVALGEDACMELLSRPPQAVFRSAMKRREPNAGIPWTVGCEAETPLLLNAHRLSLDVERSLQCRNCKPNCPINGPRHSWEFMRGESEATEILGVDAELRVNFECVNCHSIHLGVPFPAKGVGSEVQSWSMADEVVRGTFDSISSWLRVRAVSPRKANSIASRSRDASPHEAAAEGEAAARSVAPSSVEEEESVGSRDVDEATVGREGGMQGAPTSREGDGGTEADNGAAISRASATLLKGKNPATPRL